MTEERTQTLEEIREERIQKGERLRKAGMLLYPPLTQRTHELAAVRTDFAGFESGKQTLVVAGRVMAIRAHGGAAFVDLFDGTESLQMLLKKDSMVEAAFELFVDTVDRGDFLECTGSAFTTKRGEPSLLVSSWQILTKSLLPIPTEHFGIKDEDERFRKRHLDLLLDAPMREMFRKKALYWKASRRFLEDLGFEEVHTPTLETTTGGAEAQPFVTRHDDFDIDVFMRISVGELWQKRLMAAGMPKVFEVGRVFRNEGTSPDHLQEFTNIEFYAAYLNFDDGLKLMEDHIDYVLKEVFGEQRSFEMRGFTVDFARPFECIDYVETVERLTGVNVLNATVEELKAKVKELDIVHDGTNRERYIDTLWKYCRKQIAGPVWLTGHPKLVSPLAKESRERPGTVLRAQLVMAGTEFNNCYAELNNPVEQQERFEIQATLRAEGDSEAMMPDWDFVEMLEHGMPPTFGAATLGERFFAYLVDKPIRETQLFPLMRPKNKER